MQLQALIVNFLRRNSATGTRGLCKDLSKTGLNWVPHCVGVGFQYYLHLLAMEKNILACKWPYRAFICPHYMTLSFFVSFMHALRTKKSLSEVNSKNYSPDGFNTHYHSMQRYVSLINLFPHTHTVV